MNPRYRGYYDEPKSIFSGALGWSILLGFGLVVVFAIFAVMGGIRKAPNINVVDVNGLGAVINAQIVGQVNPATGVSLSFPAISQRDKLQYQNEAEWRQWSASACSASAVASVLNGFGKNVKVTDVLNLMRDEGAISSSGGLFRYGVFNSIGAKYGLKVRYSESKDLDQHFDSIMNALQKGYPVVINIQDNTYFPNGHFIVAVRSNADNTISVINPDPAPGKPVSQEWSRDSLKTYFSRSLRSAIYTPA